MDAPLLTTKLYIPAPPADAVPRPRLLALLDDGLARRLTLVSAPAGFGKTTLVSAWLAACARPAAWLSLDSRDGDPVRFLTYVVAALRTALPAIGEREARALAAPQPPPAESILTALVNALAMQPDPLVLVLDDYHVVDAPPVDDAVAFLLDHLPPHVHLVITTREDPRLPLARLRARGQMVDVRAADLRFTPAEAAAFLEQATGLALAAADVAALEARTEGWIAGLQLAALSMRGRADVHGFVQAFAGDNRYIVDYLVEEVLARRPDAERAFLLQTSILERLCGDLCAAVTGQAASGEMLAGLERANLFVVALDDRRRWYRYHHLFADVLRAHLLAETPGAVAALHRQASDWHAAHGLPADAIRHALAADDHARAAALIEAEWPAMDRTFQTATWLGWANALPAAEVDARPVLAGAYAWALLNRGEIEAAETRLAAAERWLQGEQAATGAQAAEVVAGAAQLAVLPATVAAARAFIAQARGDVTATIAHARRALDLLPPDDDLHRGIAGALLGIACWAAGDLAAAERALVEGMARLQAAGALLFALRGTYALADIRLAQGRLAAAVHTYEAAIRLAEQEGEHILRGTADLHLRLGELYRERDDEAAAARTLARGEALGEQSASPFWRYRLYLARARWQQAHGDLAGALDALDAAERHHVRGPVPDIQPPAALKARIWIAQGRLDDAQAWARTHAVTAADALSYLREAEHITLARLLLARGQRDGDRAAIDQALALLGRLQRAAEAGGRPGSVLEIRMVQSLAHAAQDDTDAALAVLAPALAHGAAEGYVRAFTDEGAPMASLLAAAAARGIEPSYARTLLAILDRESAAAASHDKPQDDRPAVPAQPLVEPLSPRELEVLQLVAQGLSNRDIAARLHLALSTVKGHNRIIFEKLAVQRRTEAVARARELGLLP